MRAVSPGSSVLLTVVSLLGFVAVARAVADRRTRNGDARLRNVLQASRAPAGEALAEATNPLGKEWLHVPVAALLSGSLWVRGGGRRSALPLVASLAAEGASRVFDRVPPHRQPPPGQRSRQKPSFPSGHALETTAVALTTAYVVAREEVVPALPAFATAAVLAVASSAGRLYLDRHWISDSLGGALLGLSIASGCAAVYEVTAGAHSAAANERSGARLRTGHER